MLVDLNIIDLYKIFYKEYIVRVLEKVDLDYKDYV